MVISDPLLRPRGQLRVFHEPRFRKLTLESIIYSEGSRSLSFTVTQVHVGVVGKLPSVQKTLRSNHSPRLGGRRFTPHRRPRFLTRPSPVPRAQASQPPDMEGNAGIPSGDDPRFTRTPPVEKSSLSKMALKGGPCAWVAPARLILALARVRIGDLEHCCGFLVCC